jgi:O-antigen/teichoic acid export membrane protein
MFLLTTKYTLLITLPATAALMLHADNILEAWVGADFAGRSATLLIVMTVPQMIRITLLGSFYVLSGLGKHRLFGGLALAQSVLAVVLGWFLAIPCDLGLLGIALGVSIPELIGSGWIVPIYCNRRLGLTARDELRQCFAPALAATVPFLLYCAAVRIWLPMHTRLEFALIFGLSLVPLTVGIWLWGIGPDERGVVTRYLARRRRALGRQRAR